MPIPLPTAEPPEVERVQRLYLERYSATLTYEAAKELLEGVLRFVYLTQIEAQIAPLRAAEPAATEPANPLPHALPPVRP